MLIKLGQGGYSRHSNEFCDDVRSRQNYHPTRCQHYSEPQGSVLLVADFQECCTT